MVSVQKSKFFLLCFLEKSSQKILFFDILDKKEWFLDQKNKGFKSAKHRHFPKGIIHGFCPYIRLSLIYFLGENKLDRFMIFQIKKNDF